MNTVDAAVRLLLEGIVGLGETGTSEQLGEAIGFDDAGRLSGGEQALLDLAKDMWNGRGHNSFVTNVSRLDKPNLERVMRAVTIYVGALA